MPTLQSHRDFQEVRHLPFCYLCGRDFTEADEKDGDHVPPKCVFNSRDRHPVLKLQTHKGCNGAHKVDDRKIGQLIAMRRWEAPKTRRDQALHFVADYSSDRLYTDNLNIEAAVWRWVRAFHAALYREPLLGSISAIQTPFPRGQIQPEGTVAVRPIRQQDLLAVETIKRNRAAQNLDSLVAYNGRLRYECVWGEADEAGKWACLFAVDIYDWKDLGGHTKDMPARGCTGFYCLPDYSVPATATRHRESVIAVPNCDPLDPFAP
jgi:hypothetical protein